ncbi:DMT family transporter [Elizabethkingia meningoseptica]|uniref:DMT family transporter n=1 Tax=Elizabethkingia meningoseptica TaxID=238 RepID=UPI0022F1BC3B|nr:DMT family transporter [Elizabethkingia meningoseptica]EJK5328176.1 DMT family transporter [Elizabethkingia meningoseptica]MCT3897455.1 DMT family transporter [Elizabethkingia anophelis]MCT4122364.1 DMT family transporter [Elizabethkingia anophelis]WBS74061.1 DMT family transporter [Elizabethkingia meningoseptica]
MKKSYFLLHTAVVLAGFTGVFGKLITLNEGLLTWYRVFFSSIFLFLFIKIFKVSKSINTKEKIKIAKVGLLITIHWVFFYASIKYSNISVGVVCYSLTSFFTALFKPLLDKKRFVFSEMVLSGITLLGISLIFHFDSSYQLGIIFGVVSSAFAALYTIGNERLASSYDSRIINYYQMFGGTIGLGLLLPIYLYFFPVKSIIPEWKDTIYLVLLSVFCTVALYVSVTEVLKKIPAFTVNLSFNLEPIYAIIIAFVFFNEGKEVNFSFYVGLFFVLLSVVLQSVIFVRRKK